MRILFCSNYFTHHQVSLSDALYELTNHNYYFVAHKEMDAERKNLGWGNDLARPYTYSLTEQEVQEQLRDLDVLIVGSFPESQTKKYSKKAKLFFRYRDFSSGIITIHLGGRHICSAPVPIPREIMQNSAYSMIGVINGATFRRRYGIPV